MILRDAYIFQDQSPTDKIIYARSPEEAEFCSKVETICPTLAKCYINKVIPDRKNEIVTLLTVNIFVYDLKSLICQYFKKIPMPILDRYLITQ